MEALNQNLQEQCANWKRDCIPLILGRQTWLRHTMRKRHDPGFNVPAVGTERHAAEERAAALQNAINDAQADLMQLSEKHSIELSQRDFIQKKTEQRCPAAEKHRITLQNTLEAAESSLARIAQTQAQWEQARQELGQSCDAVQQAAAIQRTGCESGSRSEENLDQIPADFRSYPITPHMICRLHATVAISLNSDVGDRENALGTRMDAD